MEKDSYVIIILIDRIASLDISVLAIHFGDDEEGRVRLPNLKAHCS